MILNYIFKTIQHRLAEVKTEASVGRAFCDSAMRLFMEGMVFEILICLLIVFYIMCLMNRTF